MSADATQPETTKCLFCDKPTRLKFDCEKQHCLVCEDHLTAKCPECGGMAIWLEGMVRGNYYLCFESLDCWWRSPSPPGAS